MPHKLHDTTFQNTTIFIFTAMNTSSVIQSKSNNILLLKITVFMGLCDIIFTYETCCWRSFIRIFVFFCYSNAFSRPVIFLTRSYFMYNRRYSPTFRWKIIQFCASLMSHIFFHGLSSQQNWDITTLNRHLGWPNCIVPNVLTIRNKRVLYINLIVNLIVAPCIFVESLQLINQRVHM